MTAKPSYEELENRVQELEKIESEHKYSKQALRESESLFKMLYEKAPLGYQSLDENGHFIVVNQTWLDTLGYTREEVIGKSFADFLHPDWRDHFKENFPRFKSIGEVLGVEFEMVKKNGNLILVSFTGKISRDKKRTFQQTHCIFHDITERKRAETYREMGREILQILNEPGDLQESIQRVLSALKTRTGVDAVGLRLQEGEDFPYYVQDGFSKDFLLTENTLLERDKDGSICRDKDGNVRLECTCGLIISGKTDPFNPLFTQGGSSWTNDSFLLLDLPPDQDPRLHPRNNCIHQGYASVALIPVRIQDQMYSRETCIRHGFGSMAQVPVRTNDRIVGLIQLNDKRKGRFTLETIEILEGIAAHVGSALIRKQVEEALRESEERIRTIGDNLQGAQLYQLRVAPDGGTMFTYVSSKVEELHECKPEDVLKDVTLLFKRVHPADVDEWQKLTNKSIRELTTYDHTVRIVRKSGEIRWHRMISKPHKMDDGSVLFDGVELDVTELKQAETEREKLQIQLNQAQKMESVGRLAGGVAHDFNNMLGVILGHTELALLQADENHDLYDDLKEIQTAAKRSADITKQLLAFARKEIISPRQLDLNDTVESMLNMLRRLIGEDIDLAWQPAAHIWPVKMDPSQIDQILANLCINAKDAISGVGKLTIETGRKSFDEEYCRQHSDFIPGDFVLLVVSDNGCGMDKYTQDNLFEPFFTTKEVGKGTGLGLATVYGIVKQNNGFINVYSEPGQGSTFRIYLPRLVADEDTEKVVPDKKAAAGGTETILLVEDEPSILRMTRMMLERKGYSVLSAATPTEAMEKAKNHSGSIDMLMTDVVMPKMNGRDLAGQITALYPGIRLLFMSGYTANVIAHHGVLDDGVAFIQKPFSMADMTVKVRELLDMDSDKNHG